jgi:hypothetical protein
MGLANLASSASNWLQKNSPLHKMVGEATNEYIDTGSKKALGKVMAPFAVGAAVPAAMYAAGAGVAGNLAVGASGLARGAASRISNLSGGLSKVAEGVKKVATPRNVKIGAASTALGVGAGFGVDQYNQNRQDSSQGSADNGGAGNAGQGSDGGSGNGGGFTPKGGNWSPNQDDYDKQKQRFIKDTEKGYKNLKSAIKAQLNWGDAEVGELEGGINSLIENYRTALGEQDRVAHEQIDTMRGDVRESQAKSLRELAENVRSGFLQGNAVLGGVGASDSSAAKMYSRSITKQANTERQAILEDIDTQYKELDQREGQIKAFMENELSTIENWKQSKIAAVKKAFGDYRKNLSKALKDADGNKRDDLEALDQKRLARAYQELQSIASQAAQWQSMLTGASDEMLGKIGSLKSYIVENTDYTPKDINVSGIKDFGKYELENPDDPNVQQQQKRKKVVKSFLGNPLTDDEELDGYNEEFALAGA